MAKYGVFLKPTTLDRMVVVKTTEATPADGDWASQDGEVDFAGTAVKSLSYIEVGGVIYIVTQQENGRVAFHEFDTSTDNYTTKNETVANAGDTNFDNAPTNEAVGLARRSDGDIVLVAAYNDGSNERLRVFTEQGAGWTNEGEASGGIASTDYAGVSVIEPDSSDRISWVYGDITNDDVDLRSIASDDTISAVTEIDSAVDTATLLVAPGVIDSANKIYAPLIDADNLLTIADWTSGASPTVSNDLATATYYFDTSDGGPTDADIVWTDDANAFDGSTSTLAQVTVVGTVSSNFLLGEGTTAPASGGGIRSVRVRVWGDADDFESFIKAAIYTDSLGELLGTASNNGTTADWGGYTTLSVPSGGWTWAKIQALEVKIYGTQSGAAFNDANAGRVEIELTTSVVENTVYGHGRTSAPFVAACLAIDGTDVHLLYANDADQDLYHNDDVDGGGATDNEELDAVTVNRISVKKGTSDLLYFYDDGGVTKFGVITLGGVDTTVVVPQDSLSETDNVPGISTGVNVETPQDSQSQTDNDPALNTGVTVDVPQDSLTETDNAPTVPQIVPVPQDSLTQTDNAPDILTGVAVIVPADAQTQTDNSPGINTGTNVAAPQDSLSQTDNAPTVPQIVGVPADALSQVDNVPDIKTGVNVEVPQDSLSETDNAPTVITSIGVPADSLTQTDNAPDINTGVTVAVPADALTETDNAPNVGTGIIVLAPQDTLSETDNVPSLLTGVNVVTPQDVLAQVDNDPALNTGVNVVTPADALTQADNVPSIGSGTQIDAPQDNLTQTDNAPDLNTGVTVETPQDSLAQNDNAPLANTGVLIQVPVDTLTQVDNTPDIRTGFAVAVPTDTLSIVDQVPGISTGVDVVIPANDNLTLSTFAPVITATAGAVVKQRIRGFTHNVGRLMNP